MSGSRHVGTALPTRNVGQCPTRRSPCRT